MFKSVLRKFTTGGDDGGAIQVAVFGKHPGWDDHIPDLGLNTPELVEFKRALYLEGIGGNIDKGAWDALGERGLDVLRHEFTWWADHLWIVGRLWSSRDGKGRARYPMVACVQCRATDYPAQDRAITDTLDRLETACRATESAAAVTEATDGARAALRDRLKAAQPATKPVSPLGVLAARDELGPDAEGVVRLLYHIDRQMAEYRSPSGITSHLSRSQKVERAHHVRVPRCAASAAAGARVWSEFLRTEFSARVRSWVIAPHEGDWVDLLVGEPGTREFFCISAPPPEIPLTTDVPYQIDADVHGRLRKHIGAAPSDARAGTD